MLCLIELLAYSKRKNLLHLAVERVLPLFRTELLQLQPIGRRLLILLGRVVAAFALRTRHRYDVSHHGSETPV